MDIMQFEETRFVGEHWSGARMSGRVYEACTFERCDLSRADLSRCRFVECTFIACDLSMAKLHASSLQDVRFDGSKLLGVDLSACNPMLMKVAFTDCKLDHTVLAALKLKGTRFTRCSMQGTDLSGADLEACVFEACALQDAVFDRTRLRDADLTTALHMRIDPEANDLRGARFSVDGALALLAKYGVQVG